MIWKRVICVFPPNNRHVMAEKKVDLSVFESLPGKHRDRILNADPGSLSPIEQAMSDAYKKGIKANNKDDPDFAITTSGSNARLDTVIPKCDKPRKGRSGI